VKWGKVNATIPKGQAPESITLDQAVGLLNERAAKTGGGGRVKKATKKAAKKAEPKQELSEPAPKAVKPKATKKAAAKTPKAPKKAAKSAE
jgi:DNA topoisomerase I